MNIISDSGMEILRKVDEDPLALFELSPILMCKHINELNTVFRGVVSKKLA